MGKSYQNYPLLSQVKILICRIFPITQKNSVKFRFSIRLVFLSLCSGRKEKRVVLCRLAFLTSSQKSPINLRIVPMHTPPPFALEMCTICYCATADCPRGQPEPGCIRWHSTALQALVAKHSPAQCFFLGGAALRSCPRCCPQS